MKYKKEDKNISFISKIWLQFFTISGKEILKLNKQNFNGNILAIHKKSKFKRRGGRVVEGARLESVNGKPFRGFESPSLRHLDWS